MQRTLHPTFPIKRIKAAFSNPSAGGRVFIEAETEEDVQATVRGLTAAWSSQVRAIPCPVFLRLLRVYGNNGPDVGRWVQLRKTRNVPAAYDGKYAWIEPRDDKEEGLFNVVCVLMQGTEGEWRTLYNNEQLRLFECKGSLCYNLVRPYFIFLFFLSCCTLSPYLLSGT